MRPREEKRIMDRTVGVDETREMRPRGEKGTDQAHMGSYYTEKK